MSDEINHEGSPPADEFELHDDEAQLAAKLFGYRDMAVDIIRDMLATEHALIWGEIIARAADHVWSADLHDIRINPHHLREGLKYLIDMKQVQQQSLPTRGGRTIGVYTSADVPGRQRVTERAAARKRLLAARYQGWASGSDAVRGVIGPTAEEIVHASLSQAAGYVGYKLLNPEGGSIGSVRNIAVPFGPLDNAAWLRHEQDPREYLLVIEVKSLRSWIYPGSSRLFQLLHKAAMLSQSLPEVEILPVFICRRAHITTFRMARDLGFHVIDTLGIQWLPRLASIDEASVTEVRRELGYVDLRFADGPDKYLLKQFREVLPRVSSARVERWRLIGSQLNDQYRLLAQEQHPDEEFQGGQALRELRVLSGAMLRQLPDEDRGSRISGGW